MPDLFSSQLLECQWRGISFPCTSFRVRITQSTVQHAQPDRDGARIESTGRNPLAFSASVPMFNCLSKGPNETWGTPYPDTHRKIVAAMADRTSGTLQHPSLGLVLCKAVSCESTLEAGRRDGEMLSLEWIETRDEDDVLGNVIGEDSPIGAATRNAIDLDNRISQTNFGGFDPDGNKISFEEAMRRVAGVADTASLLSRRAFGQIDRILYRIEAIRTAVVASGDPQNWPMKESLMKLRSAIQQLKKKAAATQKDTRFYVVPAPTTAGNIAAQLNNAVGDIIRLNPFLCAAPQVDARTVIRYYVTVN
jgi:hypothetical protein